jgi:dihydroxyacid dehydratase/phosphogluconate dehydratase
MRQKYAWCSYGSYVPFNIRYFFLSKVPCRNFIPVGRLNRPSLMIYGGTIRPGSCEGAPQLDIVSAFQSYGKYLQDGQTSEAEKERYRTVRHACPGPGACGGVCYV